MTEPERTGGKIRLVQISNGEAEAIETDGIGGPKLYFDEIMKGVRTYYVDPAELERWRASKTECTCPDSVCAIHGQAFGRLGPQAEPAHE